MNGDLERQGFAIEEMRGLTQAPKSVYYHPDGSPTKLLPSDPVSMKHYLAKGFSLTPPRIVPKRRKVAKESPLRCPICGFEARSELGARFHIKKCKRSVGNP